MTSIERDTGAPRPITRIRIEPRVNRKPIFKSVIAMERF